MHEKYPYYVVTFPSVHHAIKLEAKLKGQGFPLRLVPVPREISSSCGVAAKVKDTNVDDIKALIAKMVWSLMLYIFMKLQNKNLP